MSEAVLKKFGKYFLLDRIGEGGMAEIFRARLAAAGASGRFVVIKRIQGAYSNNTEFVSMFRGEVQVTMRFTHPNIVQLYESGEETGQQYIAMELVEGRNLRQILSKISQKQQRVPVPAACQIIEQAAAGLHYAHSFKDRITGEPLNLVHRDVSPQNILVSYDGNIKVIDFGIAKAATNGEATRAGVIKGKLSYLSPEQVMGDVLDGRSDVFALGIVMWELLTAKRLFVADGDNEFAVLKMIEGCNSYVKPPSTFNPEVPPELDAIVMQALSRDVKKRFQTGEEMARSIRKILAVNFSDFGPSDLSTFVKKLFHDLIVEDRKQLQQLNAKAEELIALGAQNPPQAADSAPDQKPATQPTRDATRVASLGNKFDKSQITGADKLELSIEPEKRMKIPANRPTGATGQVQGRAVNGSAGSGSTPAQRTNTGIRAMPRPQPVESSSGGALKAVIGVAVLAVGGYFGIQNFSKPDVPERDPAAAAARATPIENPGQGIKAAGGKLKIRIFPDGNFSSIRAVLNSNPVDISQGSVPAVVGEPLELVIERPGFVTYRKEFTIKETDLNDQKEYSMEVKLEPMVYGTLTLSTVPELADVTIINLDQGSSGNSQKSVVLKTPVYQEKLPVGHYKVMIRNDLLGVEKSFQIEIKEGDRLVKNGVTLEGARAPSSTGH
ncbi:MAG: serine/threonine protein kinase [Proteobacteria bacterium]|nr:serine/threonine protein kinase [Pseudomonadota bacterium]